MRKTIVAVYDTHQEAKNATEALNREGFSDSEVSLVASDHKREYATTDVVADHAETAGEKAGHWAINGGLWGGVAGLVAGLVGMSLPGVGPVVVAGPLGAALGGAITGALVGGILGGLTGLGIPEEEAHVYAESIRRGGTIVSVTIPEERVDLATRTLDQFHPVDIDERSASWKKDGWSRFDESANPYDHSKALAVPAGGVSAGTSTRRSRSYGHPDASV